MKAIFIVVISLSFLATQAQTENNGSTGLAFLKIGVDARAAGMGEAATAVANTANAVFWNPAGILAADRNSLEFTHNAWLLDVHGQSGAVVFKQKKSSIALHVQSMGVGGIEIRDIPSTDPLAEANASYSAFGLTYARALGEQFEAGISLRYLFEKIFVYSASGFATDLGIRYRGLIKNLTLGASLLHLGSMSELRNEASKLPSTFRVGAAFHPEAMMGPARILLAADMVYPLEENARFHLGGEARLWEHLLLRIGFASGYETRGLSIGAGIQKTIFRFDYSYSPFDSDLGESQRFTLYLGI